MHSQKDLPTNSKAYMLSLLLFIVTSTIVTLVSSQPQANTVNDQVGTVEIDETSSEFILDEGLEKEKSKVDFYDLLKRLDSYNKTHAASVVANSMTQHVIPRLETLFQQATTTECRSLIANHMSYFIELFGEEHGMPFSEWHLESECPEPITTDWDLLPDALSIVQLQNRTYRPNEGVYKDANELVLLYGILTHDDPGATMRLISILNDTNVNFVVHVDGKYSETQQSLIQFATQKSNVHILGDNRRVRINWGGFSMVNATLQILQYCLFDFNETLGVFDKFVHLASTSYPLASNREIKEKLAKYPVDANMLYVIMKPARPKPWGWHYFVECDDRLHRIHRLTPIQNATHGIDLYSSSQWFMLSRDFATYLAAPPKDSFVEHFLTYAAHMVVADETFFGTVLIHSPFCHKHHNENFLHLQFDRWESVLPNELRDPKKCMMLDPNHCGRSPTVMTLDNIDLLELSPDLFARKFVDSVDNRVKDFIDRWRGERQSRTSDDEWNSSNLDFEGHGVLIVATETINDDMPLCLGLRENSNQVHLVPCFYEDVIPTLAQNWSTGAVIEDEVIPHNRWQVGPCTNDGSLERTPNAVINVTIGQYSINGPRCMLKQMDGVRSGRCLDIDSRMIRPGGVMQAYPCNNKWYQFFSFGDGSVAPHRSIYSIIPSSIIKQVRNLGHEYIPYMCFGVFGRGLNDEADWDEDSSFNPSEISSMYTNGVVNPLWKNLSEFALQPVVSTQCTNLGAIIEWSFVPFIVEETEEPSPDNSTCKRDGLDMTAWITHGSCDLDDCLSGGWKDSFCEDDGDIFCEQKSKFFCEQKGKCTPSNFSNEL